jgi:hypothetical protein
VDPTPRSLAPPEGTFNEKSLAAKATVTWWRRFGVIPMSRVFTGGTEDHGRAHTRISEPHPCEIITIFLWPRRFQPGY